MCTPVETHPAWTETRQRVKAPMNRTLAASTCTSCCAFFTFSMRFPMLAKGLPPPCERQPSPMDWGPSGRIGCLRCPASHCDDYMSAGPGADMVLPAHCDPVVTRQHRMPCCRPVGHYLAVSFAKERSYPHRLPAEPRSLCRSPAVQQGKISVCTGQDSEQADHKALRR